MDSIMRRLLAAVALCLTFTIFLSIWISNDGAMRFKAKTSVTTTDTKAQLKDATTKQSPKPSKPAVKITFPSTFPKMDPPPKDCYSRLQKFKSVVLAVNYNFPHYDSTSLIRSMYEPIFGKVIFCGDKEVTSENLYRVPMIVDGKGYQGYMCVSFAMKLYPDFEGYLQTNDDIILNWWNMLHLDINKLWIWGFFPWENSHHYIFGKKPQKETWYWWRAENATIKCEKAFNATENFTNTELGNSIAMKTLWRNYYEISKGNKMCFTSWSDIFYIPKQHKDAYIAISEIWGRNKAFLETALPTILAFLVNVTDRNYEILSGTFFVDVADSEAYHKGISFYEFYNFHTMFIHPIKFGKPPMAQANINFFNTVVRGFSDLYYMFCKYMA